LYLAFLHILLLDALPISPVCANSEHRTPVKKEEKNMDNPDNIFGKTIESTGAELLRLLESGISEGFLCSEELPSGNGPNIFGRRSEEHTSELQSRENIVC